ncbi:uncharacterized protein MELLADRAFT_102534 [Melampsora larici-populina 98AG31]|uniref:Secreted protein n=1 Tax=Melampsora larici-populina (strain 98AG31 / pathotype 3-4-7) TaxID=747676 RepID=F4R730_MELLP|nr:uncharacterized protein MELLADRAFT_102534 [Melampsora larici-populina 98AG31]EGG11507.1 hypothetical protein MELLADRAFT_102534 [Melampsora larici-populina 98AG31]
MVHKLNAILSLALICLCQSISCGVSFDCGHSFSAATGPNNHGEDIHLTIQFRQTKWLASLPVMVPVCSAIPSHATVPQCALIALRTTVSSLCQDSNGLAYTCSGQCQGFSTCSNCDHAGSINTNHDIGVTSTLQVHDFNHNDQNSPQTDSNSQTHDLNHDNHKFQPDSAAATSNTFAGSICLSSFVMIYSIL